MELERVYLEISNICNLSCPFCSAVTRPPRRMSRGEFDHIIAELKGCTKYLYFHVKGEPLLHPDLPYFLKLCEDEGFQVHITTNGTLLKEQSELLLSSGSVRQVNLSLHSLSGRDRAFAEDVYKRQAEGFHPTGGMPGSGKLRPAAAGRKGIGGIPTGF